jgi:hypothetical protein
MLLTGKNRVWSKNGMTLRGKNRNSARKTWHSDTPLQISYGLAWNWTPASEVRSWRGIVCKGVDWINLRTETTDGLMWTG